MEDFSFKSFGYKKLVLLAVFIVVSVIFREYALAIVLTALTGLTAAAVNFFDLRFAGIELATFSTVVLAIAFGPAAGAAAGFFLVLLQMVFGQQVGVYMVWVVPSYVAMGLLAGLLNIPVVALGTYLTMGLHAVFLICTAVFTPEGISRYLPYAVGNSVLNVVLFTSVAPELVGLVN